MPHVRLSVRGPKKTGEAHHGFCNIDEQTQTSLVKAFETYHFRPTYAEANVGHPSCSIGVPLPDNFNLQLIPFMELNQVSKVNPGLLLVLLHSRGYFLAAHRRIRSGARRSQRA